MTLKDNLLHLRRDREAEKSEASTLQKTPEAPSRPAQEKREAFTSKLRPAQRRYIRSLALDLEAQVGRRVTVEDLLEVLLDEVEASPELREGMVRRLRGG